MTAPHPGEGGGTARSPWGFPHPDRVERRIAVLLTTAGLAVATWGLATAATEVPDTVVHFEPPPGRVLRVLPGGPAWESGVRVGQTVTAIVTGATALDWALVTSDGLTEYRVTQAGATATLRGWVPLGAIALLASLLAVPASIRMPLLGSAVGVLAGAAGSIPLTFVGNPVVSTIGGLMALAFPLGWLAIRGGAAAGFACRSWSRASRSRRPG